MIVKTENLVKSYGSLKAVDSLSISIEKGEVFGFLGPNGAGKTTFINMLCGLLKPDSGQIRVYTAKSGHSIGVCPQDIVIWENLTCMEQLIFAGEMYGYSRREARAEGRRLLESFALTQKADKLAKTLSGGMKRRLNIALALINNPELLILDEPQAGLDPQSRILVREYIQSIKSTLTIILTTHDMEEAEKLSDRICIIDHGKELVTGTIDDIKKSLGKGDIFEIEIEGKAEDDLLPHIQKHMNKIISSEESTLSFLTDNARETIVEVMDVVKKQEIVIRDMGIRRTSLEDVFIHLTGRRLRE